MWKYEITPGPYQYLSNEIAAVLQQTYVKNELFAVIQYHIDHH